MTNRRGTKQLKQITNRVFINKAIASTTDSLEGKLKRADFLGSMKDLDRLIGLHSFAGDNAKADVYSKTLLEMVEEKYTGEEAIEHRASIDNLDQGLSLYRPKREFPAIPLGFLCLLLVALVIVSDVYPLLFSSLYGEVLLFIFLGPLLLCLTDIFTNTAKNQGPILDMGPSGLHINDVAIGWEEIKEVRADHGMVGIVLNRELSEREVVQLVFLVTNSSTVLKLAVLRMLGHSVPMINIPQRLLPLTTEEIVEQINLRRDKTLKLNIGGSY